jgi:hypothetical protein
MAVLIWMRYKVLAFGNWELGDAGRGNSFPA